MNQPFNFPNGQAYNAKDLLDLCKQYPDDAIAYLLKKDLEFWLAYIGNNDFAECAANARQIEAEDRQKLEEFFNQCHSLTAPKPVPDAVTETKVEENIPASESPASESTSTIAETPQEKPLEVVPSSPPISTESLEIATPKEPPAPTLEVVNPSPQAVTESANKPVTNTPISTNSIDSQEKPSFFQVVVKFIFSIIYRNEA